MMAKFLGEAEEEMMEAAVFYQEQTESLGERLGPSGILIIAVAHQRRRPDYWQERLGR